MLLDMSMEKQKHPQRKDIRLRDYNYSSPGVYFVTICTAKRRNLFWQGAFDAVAYYDQTVGASCARPQNLPLSNWGKIVLEQLEIWNDTYPSVSLNSYVIMPNHLHILVEITADENGRPQVAPTLSQMIQQFKGAVTKRIGKPVWQKLFMEHVIRDNQDYVTRLNYIHQNPARWCDDELYIEG